MKLREILKSPVFALGHKWDFKKRTDAYESDTSALIRRMLDEAAIRDDQDWAWERWRNDASALKNRES